MTRESILELVVLFTLGVALCVAAFTLGAGITAGMLADTRAENADAAAISICGAAMLWLGVLMLFAFENR